ASMFSLSSLYSFTIGVCSSPGGAVQSVHSPSAAARSCRWVGPGTSRLRQVLLTLLKRRFHQPRERTSVRVLHSADLVHHVERGLRAWCKLRVRCAQRSHALSPLHEEGAIRQSASKGRHQQQATRLH